MADNSVTKGEGASKSRSAWEWAAPVAVGVLGSGAMLAKRSVNLIGVLATGGLAAVAWIVTRLVGNQKTSSYQPARQPESESAGEPEPQVGRDDSELRDAMVQFRAGGNVPDAVRFETASDDAATEVGRQSGPQSVRGPKGLVVV